MAETNKPTATKGVLSIAMIKKLIGAVVGIILGVYIAGIGVPEGLTTKAMWGMAVFICAIVWWIAEVFPDYVTALLMCSAWAVFDIVPFGTAFGGFSNATIWLLIGAFGMAAAVGKCGLLTRISLYLMNLFPLTFKGQTLALMVTGTLMTPLIPSGSAKIAVLAPFAAAVSDSMGYKKKTQGAGGIFAAMFLSLGCIHPLFLSGSFMCYSVVGLLPKDIQSQVTWTSWFINALPWGITVLVLGYLAILFLYKPEEEKRLASTMIKDQRAALGPMSKNEKYVSVVLVLTLLIWMTEVLHGINATIIAIAALAALLGYNVIDRNTFKSGIAWDAIMFIGCIFAVSGVFSALKITGWIGKVLGPHVAPLLAGNIYLFLAVLCIVIYLVRFVLASQLAVITIFTLLLTPLALKEGISPWIMGFTSFVAINVWILMYQNAQYLVAFFGAAGGEMVNHRQMIKLCVAYMIISIIGLLVSIPFWKLTGLIQ
ncbi:SLC13 family permease [Sporomusa sp.]|nr:SLC13 family permease [Sporomusa sp.]HWR05738.1 SLC13 family permease [Sporomusa sp.]